MGNFFSLDSKELSVGPQTETTRRFNKVVPLTLRTKINGDRRVVRGFTVSCGLRTIELIHDSSISRTKIKDFDSIFRDQVQADFLIGIVICD